jgi:cytochrome oxidase assembly protein ShyY1
MKITLANALINRGIINTNTRIFAKCPIVAMGDMPAEARLALTIDKIVVEDGTIKFQSSTKSGKRYSIPCAAVEEIDGMDPERLAAAYDIKVDGEKKSGGKKRGRIPKISNSSEEHNS